MTEPGLNHGQNTEPRVQYVLSGQPTGIAAMANAVREYDEERVQNCKEDIDTLLVFVRISFPLLFLLLTRWILGRSVLCSAICIPTRIVSIPPTRS